MELEFLGTGAGLPSKQRNVTSIALKLLDEENAIWLFDCGEGTQHQILHTTIRPRKINKIFITHLHGDHIFGLPGLLSSRSFQGGTGELIIYGPVGIKEYVETSLKISNTHFGYPIRYHEIRKKGLVFEDDKFQVICDNLDHRITCYGYRVVEKDHLGELDVAQLKKDGIPSGPIYGQLKRGEKVTLSDGRIVEGKDYVGDPKKGRIVTILGDTRPCSGAFNLAKDADVLVHESTFDMQEEIMARNYYHSTTKQAGVLAADSNVALLLLTHISARYLGKEVQKLQDEAQLFFQNTKIVHDFDCFSIPLQIEKRRKK